MEIEVEVNSKFVDKAEPIHFGNGIVMITPPIDDDYWLMRVKLSENQAIVCFPKFGTIGIGFQKETDWNTNLPYTSDATKIYNHIKHNKGDAKIRKEKCILAIQLLQSKIMEMKRGKNG